MPGGLFFAGKGIIIDVLTNAGLGATIEENMDGSIF